MPNKIKYKKPLKDYYQVLGVSSGASQQDIKRAFKFCAKTYHPDVNNDPGATRQFQELVEAYQILKMPEKRNSFDGRVISEFCSHFVGSIFNYNGAQKRRVPEFYRLLGKG